MKQYYNQEVAAIFEKLPFINVAEFAKMFNIDASNMHGYIKGHKKCGEKAYKRICEALQTAKQCFP